MGMQWTAEYDSESKEYEICCCLKGSRVSAQMRAQAVGMHCMDCRI